MKQDMNGLWDAAASAGPYAICTSLQTDNPTNTSSRIFDWPDMLFLIANQPCQSTEGRDNT